MRIWWTHLAISVTGGAGSEPVQSFGHRSEHLPRRADIRRADLPQCGSDGLFDRPGSDTRVGHSALPQPEAGAAAVGWIAGPLDQSS